MIELENDKTMVTHTQHIDNGSVVVVTDVPAYVWEEDGEEQTVYDMDVALKIDDFVVSISEKNLESNRVFTYSYQYLDASLYADAQIRMTGSSRVNFGSATTKEWKDSIDAIYKSISFLKEALKSVYKRSAIADPVLVPAPGSLLFNLQTAEPIKATQNSILSIPNRLEIQILELLMDGYNFAVDDDVHNSLIREYPQFKIATLKAIERLSPYKSSEIEEVEIIPLGEALKEFEPITLTKTTREIARNKRSWLESGSEKSDIREVVIIGQIAQLARDATFTISDIEYNYPEGKKYRTKAIYYSKIFKELGNLFINSKRVIFRGIEYRVNGKWNSIPNIREVEEFHGEVPPDNEPIYRLL